MSDQEGTKKETSGQAGAQQKQLWSQEEVQEEIMTEENDLMMPPSAGFQEQLAKTQASGTEVVSDPADAEKGLRQLQGLVKVR